jgi:hypothetical protein
MRNFIGQDGFVWWIGIVEDIDDPLTLGRCKVRCFGYHPAKSTNLVPTADLPWALSIHPLNTPNLYGTPRLGDWVFGFFLDSLSAQEPAILGYLPAIPEAASEYFGTASSLTRNFASVIDKNDVLWEVNNAKIRIANTSNVTIQSSNTITINGNDFSIMSSNNSVITSTKNLTLNGSNNLIFSDSANTTTLNALLLRISTIEDRLNTPTTALVPNTSITVITDI